MLCRACQGLSTEFLPLGKRGLRNLKAAEHKLPFSVSDLRVSVRSGCELCTLILDSLEEGVEDIEVVNEADSWSTCSDLGQAKPEDMNIKIRRSGADLLRVIGIENGITHRGILQFDAQSLSM